MTSTLRDLTAEEGRGAFGADAASYNAARPPYPDWVFETLAGTCGLKPGARVFEIGPGTGQATARLLALGADPLTAVEPDARLADYLRARLPSPALRTANTAFEDAVLEDGAFDLGAAATSFHWMEQRPALVKAARALTRGGWWAAWWNVFGDPERHDAFHEATNELLNGSAQAPGQYPFALDTEARLADIAAVEMFERVEFDIRKWTLTLTTTQMRALYASYSQFSALAPDARERLLDGLADIAERQFGGRVERNMCTALYIAQRR